MNRVFFILVTTLFIGQNLFAARDTLRIACVGNSITFGSGITSRELDSYPNQLDRLLGPGYDAENFGVSGRTMLRNGDNPLWNEPEFTQALDFNPDIVVILLGTNDSKPWNWEYKDEYVPDYIAMIDTFRTVGDPTIYACYPPPAFSGSWGIRDSIITNDIIPMIDQIIDSTGVQLVDFYTPFIDKEVLFPDGIHPSAEGATAMAEIVAQTLTGAAYDTLVADVDVLRGKSVDVAGKDGSSLPQNMLDGDRETAWRCSGGGNTAVIDIGTTEKIDMFQIDFGPVYAAAGPQFMIEVSRDSLTWETAVDQSARQDSGRFAIDWIKAADVRFIKLSITGTFYAPKQETVVHDFRALRYIDAVHAPMLTYQIDRKTSRFVRYDLLVIPTTGGTDQMMIYQTRDAGDPFAAATGLRPMELLEKKYSLREDMVHQFYAMVYSNGKKVISDTLKVDWSISPVAEQTDTPPSGFVMGRNYPNPFNACTQIPVRVSKNAHIRIDILNASGQYVCTLWDGTLAAGDYKFPWHGKNIHGRQVAGGFYLSVLTIDGRLFDTGGMMYVR